MNGVINKAFSKFKIKQRLAEHPFYGPCYVVCMVLATIQVLRCLQKYQNPIKLNKTNTKAGEYPTVPAFTFCYLRAYDSNKINKFSIRANPAFEESYPNAWDWDSVLDHLMKNLTALFNMVATDQTITPFPGGQDNLMRTKYHLEMDHGECVTMIYNGKTPVQVSDAEDVFGFILKAPASHKQSKEDDKKYMVNITEDLRIVLTNAIRQDGWMVYVHDKVEQWRGLSTTARTRDHFQVHYAEHMLINVAMTEYSFIDDPHNRCNSSKTYSLMECEIDCISKEFAKRYGCTGPWVHTVSEYPQCSTPADLKDIYKFDEHGVADTLSPNCSDKCIRRCNSIEYQTMTSSSVYNPDSNISADIVSTLSVRFILGKVTTVEEYWNYDFNQLVSDVGGSVGLFLGISIMSFTSLPLSIYKCVLPLFRYRSTKRNLTSSNILLQRNKRLTNTPMVWHS